MSKMDDFFEAIERVGQANPMGGVSQDTVIATVAGDYAGGPVHVLFDGETVVGDRAYAYVNPVTAGDRVLLLRAGHSWVVLGRLQGF